jgi:hypothetical protein
MKVLRCCPEIVVDDCPYYGSNEFRSMKLTMEAVRSEVAIQCENQRKLYLTRRNLRLTNKSAEKSDSDRPNGQLFKNGQDPTLVEYLGERTAILAAFNSSNYSFLSFTSIL